MIDQLEINRQDKIDTTLQILGLIMVILTITCAIVGIASIKQYLIGCIIGVVLIRR